MNKESNLISRVKGVLKKKKGSAIFQTIIIIAIVAILAVTTLPSLNSKIEEKATSAMDRIDTMDNALDD